MNIIDAIKSGKKFKRKPKHGWLSIGYGNFIYNENSEFVNLDSLDMLSTDWEILNDEAFEKWWETLEDKDGLISVHKNLFVAAFHEGSRHHFILNKDDL